MWDTEEHIRSPSLYPIRVDSPTGLADMRDAPAYPALFARDLKAYLCNAAMNVRTIGFCSEYTMLPRYERGFYERDGGLRPGVVAAALAAQQIATFQGGGFYRTPDKLFIALSHDRNESVLAVWSEKYTGTSQMQYYTDPFDTLDQTPRSIEQLEEIPDFYRDVELVTVKVPEGVLALDNMGAPAAVKDGHVDIDIYPLFFVVSRQREAAVLEHLGATQVLAPMPTP